MQECTVMEKLWRNTVIFTPVLLVFIATVCTGFVPSVYQVCPAHCRCQNTTVSCSGGRVSILNRIPPLVTKLTLIDSSLTAIKSDQFSWLTSLEQLTIRQSNITTIEDYAFRGLEQLQVLLLDSNQLSNISAHAFYGLPALKRLSLSGNGLNWTQLNQSCTELSSVENVNLRTNNFGLNETIPSGFSELTSLKKLDLGLNSGIQNLTEDYFDSISLLNVEYMNFDYTLLSYVHPDTFTQLTHLKQLDISNTNLDIENLQNIFAGLANSSISALYLENILQSEDNRDHLTTDVFKPLQYTELTFLDLQGNFGGFRKHGLGSHFFRYVKHLKELYLDNCHISWVAKEAFHGLHKLKKLSFRDNLVSCLNGCSFLTYGASLRHLTFLDFSNNVISNAYQDITFNSDVFPKLKTVILANNRIQSIKRDMFGELTTLKVLDMTENPIAYIEPGSFENLHGLQTLVIRGSLHLTVIQNGTFRGLRKLTHLNLNNNQLQIVHRRAFHGLHSLQILEINGNRIGGTGLPEDHLPLECNTLRKLDIGNNRFELLPTGIVYKNRMLKVLIMHYNRVSQVEQGTFHMLRFLDTLDLSYNDIMDFDDTNFGELTRLKALKIEGNPFLCSCKLRPFVDWLREIHLADTSLHKCVGPSEQRGSRLVDYRPTTWDCHVKYVVVPVLSAMAVLLVGGILVILSCRVFCCKDSEGSTASGDSADHRRTLNWLRELLPITSAGQQSEDQIEETEQVCTDMEDPLLVETPTSMSEAAA